jgi:uncharacterized protein YndB with AHSA1/START domain
MSQPMRQVFQVYVHASPERVWNAITTPDVTENWFFGGRYESDWKPGSPLVLRDPASGRVMLDNAVVSVDKPKKIVQTHKRGGSPNAPTTVTWTLVPDGEACLLEVAHDYADAAHPEAENFQRNWPNVLTGLKAYVETGKRLDLPMAKPVGAVAQTT